MRYFYFLLLLCFPILVFGQHTINGTVTDHRANPIAGANIFIEGTYDGTISREDGSFSFKSTTTGIQSLQVSYLSFETYMLKADVSTMTNLNIKLREDVSALDAVILAAGTFEAGDKARNSVLKPLDIVTTAGTAGDIVAALQTLPGAQTVGESGRLFMRGGEADETQTFIDPTVIAPCPPWSLSGTEVKAGDF